jgi:hypothetical protein
MLGEIYRPIPGYPGYEASNLGNIRSPKMVLNPFQSRWYLYVSPSINGKQRRVAVHILVCLAWHGEPDQGEEVSHRDNDFLNNREDNLKWRTRAVIQWQRKTAGTDNRGERCGTAKITLDDAEQIVLMGKRGIHPNKIAANYGVSAGHIRNIISGRKRPELKEGRVLTGLSRPYKE